MDEIENKDLTEILSSAALFESDFSIDWLIKLCERKASQILEGLESAVEGGWLKKRKQAYFCFTNKKTRDEWKQKYTAEEQSRLHGKIAELLLVELPGDENKARQIAHHLLFLSNDLERCRWLSQAGDLCQTTYCFKDALKYYHKALEDLAEIKGLKADTLFINTSIKYSKIADTQFETDSILAILEQSIRRAKKNDDLNSLVLLEMHLAKHEWQRSNFNNASKAFEKGLKLSKKINDPGILRSVTVFKTFFSYYRGHFKDAVAFYENSQPKIDTYPEGRFHYIVALTMGYCYSMFGQVSQAMGMIDAIRSEYKQIGDTRPGALGSSLMAAIMLDVRQPNEAISFIKDAEKEAIRSGNKLLSVFIALLSSYAYYLKGDQTQTLESFQHFFTLRKQSQVSEWPYPYLFELCWGIEQGSIPAIENLSLKEEIRRAKKSDNIFMIGLSHRYQALLMKEKGETEASCLQALRQSEKLLKESGNQIELARTRQHIARHYLRIGDRSRSEKALRLAAEPFSKFSTVLLPEDLKPLFKNTFASENTIEEIIQLGQRATTIKNNEEFFGEILAAANRAIGAERGLIYLTERENVNSRWAFAASRNLTGNQLDKILESPSMMVIQNVIATGKTVIQNPKMDTDENSSNAIRSLICAPLFYKQKVLGALYLDNRLIDNAFTTNDLQILSFFSAFAAIIADNQRGEHELARFTEGKKFMAENDPQSPVLTNIVGKSPAIKHVLSMIEQVAKTNATVMILGKTGVGKELVAKAIHQQSHRASGSFISINCSALPENLIESELFGHEKGSFTGAHQRRTGRFELANGGTLFLDEIGELSRETQVRLLRVLQTSEFERIGGNETIRSDFRLIIATNRNLEDEMIAGRFRDDLFYRLNVFPIQVPPLRERKEDIPLLVKHFIRIYSKKMDRQFENLPTNEMDKLKQYDWPGNVRELENIIERGTILNRGNIFYVPSLGPDTIHQQSGATINLSLKNNERRHLLSVLQKTDWKVRGPGGAAELLELPPSTLNSRLKKLGIE
ncbi:sigma 54-interacting transcriptional regulator, partial [bacterium]|nr:sigma 54-interacting transcriptional regulator [bacterium]